MSIQSEITRINGEVTSQANLISQIKTTLQDKALNSGGAIKTCTVYFDDGGDWFNCFYVSSGFTIEHIGIEDTDGYIDELVVRKNSIICVQSNATMNGFSCDGAELIDVTEDSAGYGIYRFLITDDAWIETEIGGGGV